jgi:hypothetical protein
MFYVYGVNLEGDKTTTIEKNADGMTASTAVSWKDTQRVRYYLVTRMQGKLMT